MRIAVIGGGASGMVTAYLLDKQGHHITVFERQPMLGGIFGHSTRMFCPTNPIAMKCWKVEC